MSDPSGNLHRLVGQVAAHHARNDMHHHFRRVKFPCVVPSGKFPDVAVHVLFAEMFEGFLISPLKHRPERLHPVRVHHVADIFADAVVDSLMPHIHAEMGGSVIR